MSLDLPKDDAAIINCHTHIFTVKDVPPELARSIAPSPLHKLIRIGWIAGRVKWWTDFRAKQRRQRWYKKWKRSMYYFRMGMKRYFILRLIKTYLFLLILLSAFHDQYTPLIKPWLTKQKIKLPWLDKFDIWLGDSGLLIVTGSIFLKIVLLGVFLFLFPSGRNLLFGLLRQVNRFFKMIPGKQTTEILGRYLNIVRYANYEEQSKVFSRLKLQYPPGSSFVVLPMDMEFMGAGKPERPYHEQMEMLAKIKHNHKEEIYPFIFVDPRREKAGDKDFFKYDVIDGKVVLLDCFIKDYIETKKFSGFKIYPALGYYAFDEKLLPLWKYAADNDIPIMTHCIRGVIYYRGRKEKKWDTHPVFEMFIGDDNDEKTEDYAPLLLPQMKPVDVQEIFTHPLNYACLLKKELLINLVRDAKDDGVRKAFGYDAANHTMTGDLDNLKICFGHFGGEDEWAKFFERDRTNWGHQLIREEKGIDFLFTNKVGKNGKLEQIWNGADWYSIICSLMLQHPNVYADISYILHGDAGILPLLRSTLKHKGLREKVLYGSDFYVVRNHKSDKNMFADMRGALSQADFQQIAVSNPIEFLKRRFPLKT